MYRIDAETVIGGDLPAVWAVATDVNAWASWDPHEREARLDGGFVAGGSGWSQPAGGPATTWTLTEVVPGHRWSSACALPGGSLTGDNVFESLGEGRVRCARSVLATGPLVPLFRLWFGRRIRRDMFRTWAALEREVARRARAAVA